MARGVWLQGHALLRGAGGQARPAAVTRERRLRVWRHDVGAHDGLLRLCHAVRTHAPAASHRICQQQSWLAPQANACPVAHAVFGLDIGQVTAVKEAHRQRACRDDVDVPSVQQGLRAAERRLARHPDFPNLPASVPLTYVLSMKACLGGEPRERPSFTELATLLEDCSTEVLSGEYINSEGNVWVRARLPGACWRFALPEESRVCGHQMRALRF
jgi:hypothetical protein